MPWRLLFSPAATGPYNMALDEALMERARATGEWTLRVYAWSAPTLSFGRNQRARGGYDLDRLSRRGIAVVRRPTGGRAILHYREVTYSVTGPIEADVATGSGGLRESYARINRLLVEGLRALGVEARVVDASPGRAPGGEPPGLLPCFHHPSPGEIVHSTRKLVGSAQWRCDGALLQHGSILVDDDQMHISSFLIPSACPSAAPLPSAATLRDALGRIPSLEEVASALFATIRATIDPDAEELIVDDALRDAMGRLRDHYLDHDWTWRR